VSGWCRSACRAVFRVFLRLSCRLPFFSKTEGFFPPPPRLLLDCFAPSPSICRSKASLGTAAGFFRRANFFDNVPPSIHQPENCHSANDRPEDSPASPFPPPDLLFPRQPPSLLFLRWGLRRKKGFGLLGHRVIAPPRSAPGGPAIAPPG